MNDNLKLFMYTFEEYLKFSTGRKIHDMIDDFDNDDYVSTNTRLIILRKYVKENEPVSIKTIIGIATVEFPNLKSDLDELLKEYQQVENQQFEYRLANGEIMNLYETIEDVMYGLYLHADYNRINRLRIQNERMRFVAVRKYVEEIERILFELYDLLKNNVQDYGATPTDDVADIIYIGDEDINNKNITSKYWQNLSGSDINDDEVESLVKQMSLEDKNIMLLALLFTNELKKETMCIENLKQFVVPSTRQDWGDFSAVKRYYEKIPNAGLSTKVRYNKRHDMAYVRIMPKVDKGFKIESSHLIPLVYEICFYKENETLGWKIYSFGGHLDDVFIEE